MLVPPARYRVVLTAELLCKHPINKFDCVFADGETAKLRECSINGHTVAEFRLCAQSEEIHGTVEALNGPVALCYSEGDYAAAWERIKRGHYE